MTATGQGKRLRHLRILRRVAEGIAALLTSAVLLLGGAYGIIQYGGNFHAVEPGTIYRSAQLDAADLTHRLQDNGIRSILNLRGADPGEAWYEDERSVALALGVRHIDCRLSATKPLTADQMHEVLQLIEKAPKPLLIHCQGGADRTGLVSALYLASRGESTQRVADALSVRYGHFPFAIWDGTQAMDDSLTLFLSEASARP
jgi:undecaprenyl-diphosphatase